MIAQDFIIQKMMELTERFPLVLCRYEWNPVSDAHYIEVSPKDILQDDPAFFEEKSKIIFHFLDEYPLQAILFLSPEDIIKVKNPVNISRGRLYGMAAATSYPELTKKCSSYNFGTLVEDLKKYEVSFPKELHHIVKVTEAISCDITKMKSFHVKFSSPPESIFKLTKLPTCEWAGSVESKKIVAGESKFALSA